MDAADLARWRRAANLHPTPQEIRMAIDDAIFDHDSTADPRDRFPLCAHRLIREAVRRCTTEHYRRQDRAR